MSDLICLKCLKPWSQCLGQCPERPKVTLKVEHPKMPAAGEQMGEAMRRLRDGGLS